MGEDILINLSEQVVLKAKKVKLLLMDCDGVLTDGRLYFTEKGESMKVFHVRDGQGLALWHQSGFSSGIITGRGADKILQARANEIGIKYLKIRSHDKIKDFEDILRSAELTAEEVAYIGDDIGDIGLLKKVGFPAAPFDAISNLNSIICYRTKLKGGYGAVRELTDLLLTAKNI